MDGHDPSGISFIACTNKEWYAENIMENFYRQRFSNKQLILILNKNSLAPEMFSKYQKGQTDIKIYQLDESVTLGGCLNFGVSQARYEYVSKMDDDDYYGPQYLEDIYEALVQKKGDVVGKPFYLTYYVNDRILTFFKEVPQNEECKAVSGACISFSKEFFKKCQFDDVNVGEDYSMIMDCREKGYKIYATSKDGYMINRYKDLNRHTWKREGERRKNPAYYDVLEGITYNEALRYANGKLKKE